MVRVTITRKGTHTRSVHCSGHALFDREGRDIVCAGVSILVINTLNSIEKFTKDSIQTTEKQEGGVLNAEFPKDLSHDSELLISSMEFGLQQIQASYGARYLSLTTQEV